MKFPSEIDNGIVSYVPKPLEIRRAREKADITQAQAAQLVHTKTRSWQQWEYGEARMSAASWELFCMKTNNAYVPNPSDAAGLALSTDQNADANASTTQPE